MAVTILNRPQIQPWRNPENILPMSLWSHLSRSVMGSFFP